MPQFFSNDAKALAQSETGTAEILDAHTGKATPLRRLNGDFTISPNGEWLAYKRTPSNGPLDGRAYLTSTGKVTTAPIATIGQQKDAPPTFSFSSDSFTLAVGIGDTKGAHIDFYNTKTGKLTRTWSDVAPSLTTPHPSYQTIQWSRDGQFFFSSLTRVGDEMGQQVWRIRDGKKVASGILLEDLNPHLENGGRLLTYGGDDGEVNLCLPPDLNHNFKQLLHLPNQQITAAVLSPDGSYLLAGTRTGTLYRQRLK